MKIYLPCQRHGLPGAPVISGLLQPQVRVRVEADSCMA